MILYLLVSWLYCGDVMPSNINYKYEIYSSQKKCQLVMELRQQDYQQLNTSIMFKIYKNV